MIITLVSSILLVSIIAALLLKRNKHDDLDSIPGPAKLPLIGNLHLLLLSDSPAHHVFRDLAAKHGALMRVQMGDLPFLLVSSAEIAAQVFRTHDVAFANRPQFASAVSLTYKCTDIGVAPYGEYWRQLRRICTLELLSARRVRHFRPVREEENANSARWIASREGSPVNLSERVYESNFDVTSKAAFGKLAAGEKQTLGTVIKEIMKVASGFSLADLYPSSRLLPFVTGLNFKVRNIFRQMDRILDIVINQHTPLSGATQRPEDLADVLLKYQQEDHDAQLHLTADNIKAVILDMFLAGGETSGTVVEWAMAEMMRSPTTLKKAQDEARRIFDDKGCVEEEKIKELKYLKLVIKETLRMHPPLPLLVPRQSSERCEINGYEIPAKTRLIVNAWALGRDPNYWNDAEKFMPERFEESSIDFKGNNLEYIPFGAGRRMCPGMAFGLANVESSLAMLLYHFDWKMPAGMKNEELDMTEVFASSAKRRQNLILIPTLKRPLQLPTSDYSKNSLHA